MRYGRVFAAVVIATALTGSLSGCAGKSKVRLSAKQMCEAHGGKYSAQGQTCDYTVQRRDAKLTCEQQGGVYWPAEQFCEIEAGH